MQWIAAVHRHDLAHGPVQGFDLNAIRAADVEAGDPWVPSTPYPESARRRPITASSMRPQPLSGLDTEKFAEPTNPYTGEDFVCCVCR